MQRTTSSVNYFRITPKASKTEGKRQVQQEKDKVEEKSDDEIIVVTSDDVEGPEKPLSPTEIHSKTCENNEKFRSSETVVEKTFDLVVGESIFPADSMRSDTKLVLIDVPGINDSESSQKYREYLTSKWDEFDCAILVMDAAQGVNTIDHMDLINFVHSHNQEKKQLPTIIVGNKVDDPDDEEIATLVQQTRDKAVEIFGDGCSKEALSTLLDDIAKGSACCKDASKMTAFIPLSA